jgi:hypothetical protein
VNLLLSGNGKSYRITANGYVIPTTKNEQKPFSFFDRTSEGALKWVDFENCRAVNMLIIFFLKKICQLGFFLRQLGISKDML